MSDRKRKQLADDADESVGCPSPSADDYPPAIERRHQITKESQESIQDTSMTSMVYSRLHSITLKMIISMAEVGVGTL